MGHVVVAIAGRTYRMACEDGQEEHLERLAADIDARMGTMRSSFGEIGDQRLVVMAALTIADELDGARRRVAELEAQVATAEDAAVQTDHAAQARVAQLETAVEAAAVRLARLAETLNAVKS